MTANTINSTPCLVIVMGVAGCGKSTLSRALAGIHQYQLIEADDFHSAPAKAMMAAGEPLTDALRMPWIEALCRHLTNLRQLQRNCVLACSGLRRQHRQRFRSLGFNNLFIWLHGDAGLIRQRLAKRDNHFFNMQLLDNQFCALQQPDNEADVVAIAINQPLSDIIAQANAVLIAHREHSL